MLSSLEIKEKKAVDIMIDFSDVYSINYVEPIDKEKVKEII